MPRIKPRTHRARLWRPLLDGAIGKRALEALDLIAAEVQKSEPRSCISGFSALSGRADETRHWEDDPGILTGAAGIALALLAATTSIEPEWDRMLLLSTPGRK